MPGEYAAKTDVPVSRSRDEIERTLQRFGATAFAYYAHQSGEVAIQFEIKRLRVVMRMMLPDRAQFRMDSRGRVRVESAIEKDWEQACRQRWRSLANGIKAKLALIDDGISTIEREFMADILLPDGRTVAEATLPQVAIAYETGQMPPMLPGVSVTAKVVELPSRTG
ncbi:MAG: hypothetical protein AB7R89_13850 [Dehalococcoidia bacterium]